MTTANSGAVFFLGTRAHYQVLQQPETFDKNNGNASTETIYQNSSVQELWRDRRSPDLDSTGNYIGDKWSYCDTEVSVTDEKVKLEVGTGVKRRHNRRASETTLCERDSEMKPALLNNIGECGTPKLKSSRQRASLLRFLTSLARRKRRMNCTQLQYMQHLELTSCTYKESCRCLDCQSRYFECDESDEYSSDESEYSRYVAQQEMQEEENDEDEVFVDTVPDDNTSTDLLIQGREKMSTSSDEDPQEVMEIEVAAGTPVLLNYLLTHPITCCIQ